MNIAFFSLSWENSAPLNRAHKKVMNHFGIPVNYIVQNGLPHGVFMNEIMKKTENDFVGFFDSDCVITNQEIVRNCIDYVKKNDTFIGIAQVSNHIPPSTHIFAAPAFFIIGRKVYEELGRVSFSETYRADVGEELSYAAEQKGKKFRTLFPTHYERDPDGEVWALGSYGKYGIGTHFQGGIYHLYQGRFQKNVDLFDLRCSEIISGAFRTDTMKSCTSL